MIVSNDMLDEPDNTCANVQTAALVHSSYCTDHQSHHRLVVQLPVQRVEEAANGLL